MINNNKGLLLVVSGPSGVGKGTVCKQLEKEDESIYISTSATTRKPREGEIDGANYHFLSEDDFKRKIADNDFLEWAVFCENYYGTPKKAVLGMIEEGKDVILEIDVQGALKIKEKYPDGVYIFLLPPSLKELRSRIEGRGTETEDKIERRMETAVSELAQVYKYDYLLVNNTVEDSVKKLKAIITSEKLRTKRTKLNFFE